jgi:hypothetical protein
MLFLAGSSFRMANWPSVLMIAAYAGYEVAGASWARALFLACGAADWRADLDSKRSRT